MLGKVGREGRAGVPDNLREHASIDQGVPGYAAHEIDGLRVERQHDIGLHRAEPVEAFAEICDDARVTPIPDQTVARHRKAARK
jgi:hypothetical protein